MPQTYHHLGFKVDHINMSVSLVSRVIELSPENPKILLLEIPAFAELSDEATKFMTAARIFIPVKLLDSFAGDIETEILCRRVGTLYSLPLTSLVPVETRNAIFSVDNASKFASYFTPDDTTVPAFLYKLDRNSPFLLDFKDVLQPLT